MTPILLALVITAPVPIKLAAEGRPLATIVLPVQAPDRLREAATTLQRVVQIRCGVTLPLRDDGTAVDGIGLYLGETAASRPDDPPPAGAHPESFAVRVRDGSVFFAGRYPTPTAFAVYTWLEDELGVRWFAPGELFESIPTGPAGELTVPTEPRVVLPPTTPRLWSGHDWLPSWRLWNQRNKTAAGEVMSRRQFQNNLYRVFPPDQYATTHPEYYPLINGQRRIPEPGERYWRPCESNPEVLRLTVEDARQFFDTHPTIDSYSLGMDDIAFMCGCDGCRAMDPHPDSYERRKFSDRHYKFVNAVARELAKTHPDKYIGTLIYAIARELPETVDKLEPNVFGFITENSSRWWVPGRKEQDQALTAAWRKRVSHLSRYDYLGLGSFTPRYYPHALDEQIKYDKSLGLEGMYVEVYTWLPVNAPMIWALAKLQWQPEADVDALLREYFERLYGPAAADVAAAYDILERSYATDRPNHQAWEHRRILAQAAALEVRDLDAAEARLAAAVGKADNDAIRQRLDILIAGLRFGGYAIRTYAASASLAQRSIDDSATARQVIDDLAALASLSEERVAFWAACHDRDDLVGETIRGLGDFKQYLPLGQVNELESGALTASLRVLSWAAEHDPVLLQRARDRLAARPDSPFAAAAEAFWMVRDRQLPNQASNAGFDTDQGWGTWSRSPDTKLALLPDGGRQGGCALIQAADSAVFMQNVPCAPGERWLALGWSNGVKGHLAVRFQKPDGGWLEQREFEPKLSAAAGATDWQPLAAVVTVPEGAGRLVLMLGASAQGDDEAVRFDDAGLYRLP